MLEAAHIDWYSKFINVQRSFKRGVISATKTGKTRRIDMSDQFAAALFGLYRQRKEEALRSGKDEVVATIFHKGGNCSCPRTPFEISLNGSC